MNGQSLQRGARRRAGSAALRRRVRAPAGATGAARAAGRAGRGQPEWPAPDAGGGLRRPPRLLARRRPAAHRLAGAGAARYRVREARTGGAGGRGPDPLTSARRWRRRATSGGWRSACRAARSAGWGSPGATASWLPRGRGAGRHRGGRPAVPRGARRSWAWLRALGPSFTPSAPPPGIADAVRSVVSDAAGGAPWSSATCGAWTTSIVR